MPYMGGGALTKELLPSYSASRLEPVGGGAFPTLVLFESSSPSFLQVCFILLLPPTKLLATPGRIPLTLLSSGVLNLDFISPYLFASCEASTTF